MILYLILSGFDLVVSFVVNLIPIFKTPDWITNNLSKILSTVYSFNEYLPISECFTVVLFLLSFTLSYKILKIILNKVGVNMNS